MILNHPFDVEILNADHIVVLDDLCTELLLKVITAVSDLLMDPGNLSALFLYVLAFPKGFLIHRISFSIRFEIMIDILFYTSGKDSLFLAELLI